MADYENKIALLSQEIDRLNSVLKNMREENKGLENNNRALVQELEGLRRGNSEFEYRITQTTQEYKLKITTIETRLQQVQQ